MLQPHNRIMSFSLYIAALAVTDTITLIAGKSIFILKQECIPVGCVPSAAVAFGEGGCVPGEGGLPGGVCLGRLSAYGVCLWGVCPRGVCPGGTWQGGVCPSAYWDTPPPCTE